jgi:asparagine synthetase B (glutamine-hydrolysing)
VPNLVGLHDPTASRPDLEAALARMLEAVDLPAFRFERRVAFGEGVAVGNLLPGMEDNLSQPAFDRGRGVWLMLDGELLGVQELRAALRARGVAPGDGDDDARLALQAYVTFGERFVDHLNGTWNAVIHDPGARRTVVVTDRLGSRLLFAAEDGPRFAFSTEVKGVVAGRARPSVPGGVGLFGLLRAGTHHGDLTWLEGIRLVPPGAVVELCGRRPARTRRHWKLHFREGGPELSERECADAFARTLRAATARATKLAGRHPFAITLSGGLDSRAVALTIPRHLLPMPAITYGDEDSNDVRFARQLAEAIGLEHEWIEPERARLVAEAEAVFNRLTGQEGPQGFYSAQLDRIVWRSEGLALFDGLSSMLWHPIYRRRMRFMLNGAAGDAMTGSHLTPDLLLAPRRDALIADLFRRRFFQPAELLRPVLAPAFFARHDGELREVFAADFDGIEADDPLAIANIWDMEQRQRRGAFTSFAMERYFCTCRSPFLDHELVDVLSRIPGRWRFQQRIYKRMLVEHFPEARHVPWAYTGGRITASPAYEFAREVVNFGVARARRLLPGQREAPARWAFRDPVKMMREDPALHRRLDAFTRSEHFPSHVLDAPGVRRLVEDFAREGGAHRHALFTHLLGLARAIELFVAPARIAVTPEADPARFGVPTDGA